MPVRVLWVATLFESLYARTYSDSVFLYAFFFSLLSFKPFFPFMPNAMSGLVNCFFKNVEALFLLMLFHILILPCAELYIKDGWVCYAWMSFMNCIFLRRPQDPHPSGGLRQAGDASGNRLSCTMSTKSCAQISCTFHA